MSRKRYDTNQNRLDEVTSQRFARFLAPTHSGSEYKEILDKDREASRDLLPSATVKGKNHAQAFFFYGILRDRYNTKIGLIASNLLADLSVAHEGSRANQIASIMEGQLPKEVEVEVNRM